MIIKKYNLKPEQKNIIFKNIVNKFKYVSC